MSMRKMLLVVGMALLCTTVGFAQASGSFNYGTGQTACVLNNDNNGTITGGQQCASSLVFGGTGNCGGVDKNGNPNPPCNCIGSVTTGIKTSSGNGNVFVVRPSAVVGLLTDVTVSSKQIGSTTGSVSSSALAGVDFKVTVAPLSGQSEPTVIPSGYVTYDARYVQISTNLFQALAL